MSLNPAQRAATIQEFRQSLALIEQTPADLAAHFNVSENKINQILQLQQRSLEDPWIVRNYLQARARKSGHEPVVFSALAGEHQQYWFLNSHKIDRGELSRGKD